jgi:hypothetical protein
MYNPLERLLREHGVYAPMIFKEEVYTPQGKVKEYIVSGFIPGKPVRVLKLQNPAENAIVPSFIKYLQELGDIVDPKALSGLKD